MRRVPGFRSGVWWHAALAICWYLLCLTTLLRAVNEDPASDEPIVVLVLATAILAFLPWIVLGGLRWIAGLRPRVNRRTPTKRDPRGAEAWSASAWDQLDTLTAHGVDGETGAEPHPEPTAPPPLEPADVDPPPTPPTPPPTEPVRPPSPRRPSAAGRSAQREHERRMAAYERHKAAVRDRYPLTGGIRARMMQVPQSTISWAKGAEGERQLGRHLDSLTGQGVVVLHDRAIPRSRTNIDHIVVAPSGIWVIDTKNYKGRVEKRDVGSWLRADLCLYVGGRNRTDLVDGMDWQVEVVRDVVGPDVPIRPALCFIGVDFPIYAMKFMISGVMVTCVRALKKAIRRPGPLPGHEVARLAALIDEALPPAV